MTEPDVLGRALLKAFADRGYEAALPDAGTAVVTAPDGKQVKVDVREWRRHAGRNSMAALPGIAAEFVERFETDVRRAGASLEDGGSNSGGLRVRIYPEDAFPEEVRDALVVRPLASGLLETVVVDYPDSIVPLQKSALDGRSVDEAFAEALARSVDGEPHHIMTRELYGVPLTHIGGEHRYVGAHVHVLKRYVHPDKAPHGALVAFPIPELLLVHPLGKAPVFAAMEAAQALAARHVEVGEKAISPQLYWWRPGAYEELDERAALASGGVPDLRPVRAEVDEENAKARLLSDEQFAEVVRRLLEE
ncbi:hypothetical protein Arub01_22160 [Actinomadura rubrobrunea]|uniref:Uncharacterized protein n=1 Tax=Actinomadura rubrobrunea TaxID=115335 RepID=A0A9W6PWB1_9ACTN|nr:hypothetical protein [Actinomadura rubrobrunea]GLW63972.1 hypothetical protein Arub01_22160 [Actinomadura rubrobrunea]